MPYDPKLGVTQAEWERLLKNDDADAFLQVVSQATYRIDSPSDGVYLFQAPPDYAFIHGISVDLVKGTVKTAFGILDQPESFSNNPMKSMGRWSGLHWQKRFDLGNGDWVLVNFYVGRLADNSRGLVYYYLRTRETIT